jgi:DNA-binding NarL/FixJ family response regulator
MKPSTPHSIRLLLVDDMPQVRKDLGMILLLAGGGNGLELEIAGEAGNGQEAIGKFIALLPDAVLMDLEMPVMDGCTAAREIKRLDPSIWIVALSVHSDEASRMRALQSGIDIFLEKGIPVTEMVRAIKSGFQKENANEHPNL